MSDQTNHSSSDQPTNPQTTPESQAAKPQPDREERIVDVRDLVYTGGYDRDPQEILGNPAVAPPMLSEGRDLRVDLFKDADETLSSPSDSDLSNPNLSSSNPSDTQSESEEQ